MGAALRGAAALPDKDDNETFGASASTRANKASDTSVAICAPGYAVGMCKYVVFVLTPWLFQFPFLRSQHGKVPWEPWRKAVTNAMATMAKRRAWQQICF